MGFHPNEVKTISFDISIHNDFAAIVLKLAGSVSVSGVGSSLEYSQKEALVLEE
jgi:hypothetical protein